LKGVSFRKANKIQAEERIRVKIKVSKDTF